MSNINYSDVNDCLPIIHGNHLKYEVNDEFLAKYSLPTYHKLASAYPDYKNYTATQVKELIGGNVNAEWITNTCAIRMSRALNYNGIIISRRNSVGMNTISGGDKKWYAFRIRELRKWLNVVLPSPVFDMRKREGEYFDKSRILGVKGIIAFDIRFTSATGHFDLWNGNGITNRDGENGGSENKDWYSRATRITLWQAR